MKNWAAFKTMTIKMPTRRGLSLLRVVAGIACLVVALLVFAAPAQTRPVLLAVGALAVVFALEVWRRRKWERGVITRLANLDDSAQRMMRDVARQRQEAGSLREALSATGETLSIQGKGVGADGVPTIEQRMLRTIAAELSRLSVPETSGNIGDVLAGATALDIAMIEHYATATDGTASLSDAQVVDVIKAAISQNRVDLFLQPIVTLPQRKPRFAEAFARIRIRDGVHMPAERYVDVARAQNLLPAIDNLLLLEGLKALRAGVERDPGIVFFCNITSLTLHDGKFMTDLIEFIAQNRTLAQRLVFELTQHDMNTMRHDVMPVLAGLARLGCRFSLDQVRDLNLSAEDLATRHIRFVKIDAAIMVNAMRKAGGADRLQQLKTALDLEGIDLVAARVESERQLVELLDVGIDYGQGYLFAPPEHHMPQATS